MTHLLHDVYFCLFIIFFWALYLGRLPCIHFFLMYRHWILYIWYLVIYGQYLWVLCLCSCVFTAMCMDCVWIVSGYVYGLCLDMCMAMCMDIGSRSSARPGTYSLTRPIYADVGTYSFTGPISTSFGSYSFMRPIWMTLRIFPIFPKKN